MSYYRDNFRDQGSFYDRPGSGMRSRGGSRGGFDRGGRGFDRGGRGFDRGGRGMRSHGFDREGPESLFKEIASKQLYIQSKKFYIDLKESKRGKFIKISEVAPNGQKMRIIMDLATGGEFHDRLSEFCEAYASLGPGKVEGSTDSEGKIKSETIFRESRRYYLDLKENHRGRFLKVAMTLPSHERTQIVIPAHGMIDIRDALTDILNEHGREDTSNNAVNGNQLQIDNRTYFFDVGSNPRGTYLRISEVSGNFRAMVTVPETAWDDFITNVDKATGGAKKVEVEKN